MENYTVLCYSLKSPFDTYLAITSIIKYSIWQQNNWKKRCGKDVNIDNSFFKKEGKVMLASHFRLEPYSI